MGFPTDGFAADTTVSKKRDLVQEAGSMLDTLLTEAQREMESAGSFADRALKERAAAKEKFARIQSAHRAFNEEREKKAVVDSDW